MVSQLSTGEGNFLCHLLFSHSLTLQNQMKLNRTVAIGFAALLLCVTACAGLVPLFPIRSWWLLLLAMRSNMPVASRSAIRGGITRISVRNPWDTASFIATYYLVRNARVRVPAGGRKVVFRSEAYGVHCSRTHRPLQLMRLTLSSIVRYLQS